jgi:hypothetical protein
MPTLLVSLAQRRALSLDLLAWQLADSVGVLSDALESVPMAKRPV